MKLVGSIKAFQSFLSEEDWTVVEGLVREATDLLAFGNLMVDRITNTPASDDLLIFTLRMNTYTVNIDGLARLQERYGENRYYKAWMLWIGSLWEVRTSKATLEQIENLLKQDITKWHRLEFLRLISIGYDDVNIDVSRNYRRQGISLVEDDPNLIYYKCIFLYLSASTEWTAENYDLSFTLAKRSVDIARENDFVLELPSALDTLAITLPVHERFDVYEEALSLLEEHGIRREYISVLNHHGYAYAICGEFEAASNKFENACEMVERNKLPIHYPFETISEIYANYGLLERAIKYAKQGLKIAKKYDPKNAVPYFNLARALILKGEYEKASKYLERGGKIAQKSGEKEWMAGYYLLKGLSEQERGNITTAEDLYEKALDLARIIYHVPLIVRLLLHLSEINLADYIDTSDKKRIAIAQSMLSTIKIIATEQGLIGIHMQIDILRALIATLLDQKDSARFQLERMQNSCGKFGLLKLREIVRSQIKSLDQTNTPKSILKRFKKFASRITVGGIETRRIRFRILGSIMILNTSGIEVFSKYLDERLVADPSLIAGLITAVSSIAQGLTPDSRGQLQSIVHEDITVVLDHEKNITCALFCDRDCSEARLLVRAFVKQFANTYAEELDTYEEGLVKPIDATNLFLELLTQQTS